MRSRISILLLMLTLCVPAYAYIEPGAGSFLIQLLVGIAAGLAFCAKSIFYFFKGLLARKGAKPETNNAAPKESKQNHRKSA